MNKILKRGKSSTGLASKTSMWSTKNKNKSKNFKRDLILLCIGITLIVGGSFYSIEAYRQTVLVAIKERLNSLSRQINTFQAIQYLQALHYQQLIKRVNPQKYWFLSSEEIEKLILQKTTLLIDFNKVGAFSSDPIKPKVLEECQRILEETGSCSDFFIENEQLSEGQIIGAIVGTYKAFSLSENLTQSVDYFTGDEVVKSEGQSFIGQMGLLASMRKEVDELERDLNAHLINLVMIVTVGVGSFTFLSLFLLKKRHDRLIDSLKTLQTMLYLLPSELVETNAYAMNFLKSA